MSESLLHPNQAEAVTFNDGRALVLAGPGSGKTRVLTERMSRILAESPRDYFRILALTFTNKAAKEMRDRLSTLNPTSFERATLTTFHSLAADLLRQHGSHIGLDPNFVIMSTLDERLFALETAVSEAGLILEGLDAAFCLEMIEECQAGVVGPEDSIAFLSNDQDLSEFPRVYACYLESCCTRSSVDFGSLIYLAIQLLESKQALRRQFQTIYPHLSVDEFQDTNASQYRLMQLLVGEGTRSLFVVADDDQIIYEWNGANAARLEQFFEEYQPELIQLPANYRCPEEIVTLANNLSRHNPYRFRAKDDQVSANGSSGSGAARLLAFSSMPKELQWLADDLSRKGEEAWSETLVLARTRRVAEGAVVALSEAGIRAMYVEARKEFLSNGFRFLFFAIKCCVVADASSLSKVSRAFYNLTGFNVKLADGNDGNPLGKWLDQASKRTVDDHDLNIVIRRLQELLGDGRVFRTVIREIEAWITSLYTEDAQIPDDDQGNFRYEYPIWRAILDSIVTSNSPDDLTLSSLVQQIDLASKMPVIEGRVVTCMTIHGAKGLEFDHVYLIGLIEGTLPDFRAVNAGESSRELAEERRSCFVAITRAKKELTLTYPMVQNGYRKFPSRFISEMGLPAIVDVSDMA